MDNFCWQLLHLCVQRGGNSIKKWVDVYQNPKANPRCVASGLVHDKRINVPEILARHLICTAFKGLAWVLEDCALDLNCSSDGVPGICWSHSCYYWGHFGPYLQHLLQLFLQDVNKTFAQVWCWCRLWNGVYSVSSQAFSKAAIIKMYIWNVNMC